MLQLSAVGIRVPYEKKRVVRDLPGISFAGEITAGAVYVASSASFRILLQKSQRHSSRMLSGMVPVRDSAFARFSRWIQSHSSQTKGSIPSGGFGVPFRIRLVNRWKASVRAGLSFRYRKAAKISLSSGS